MKQKYMNKSEHMPHMINTEAAKIQLIHRVPIYEAPAPLLKIHLCFKFTCIIFQKK